METKKSKPTAIIFKNEWNGKFIFVVTFENGDKGDLFSKSNPATGIEVGREVEYTIETKQKGSYTNTMVFLTSEKRSGGGGRKFDSAGANKRCALECAARLGAANNAKAEDVTKVAEYFNKWLSS